MSYNTIPSIALDPRRNPYAVWARSHDRLEPEVWPHLTPRFTLGSRAKIFTMGSCFARNIEEHLERLGYDVPVKRFHHSSSALMKGAESQILNKYTPPSIFQELKWASDLRKGGQEISEESISSFLYRCVDGLVIDTNLNDFVPVSLSEAISRRKLVFDLYGNILDSDCVVITLGQIESWYDREQEVYIQHAPAARQFRNADNRFEFRLLSFSESKEFTTKSIDLISRENPRVKFLLTTSPVSMNRTFTDWDVITSYCHTKSILRAVCGEIYLEYDNVDYFPSFESAVLTKSWNGWSPDKLHVTDEFVGKIVDSLTQSYLQDGDPAAVLYSKSYAAEKAGDLGLALEFAGQAVSLKPSAVDIYLHHARLLVGESDFAGAERSLAMALALEPGSGEALSRMSETLSRLGRDDEALAYAWQAVSSEPAHAGYRAQLAELLSQQNELDEAEAQIRRAIEILPRFGRFHLALSGILDKAQRLDEAVAEARAAVQVWPDVASARITYAGLLIRSEDYEEARKQQERAIALGATYAAAFWQLSVIFSRLGKHEEAINAAEKAVEIAPDNVQLAAYLHSLRLAEQ